MKHFVFVGSMGGTQPENFLNTIGKKPDGTGGDILIWKRLVLWDDMPTRGRRGGVPLMVVNERSW